MYDKNNKKVVITVLIAALLLVALWLYLDKEPLQPEARLSASAHDKQSPANAPAALDDAKPQTKLKVDTSNFAQCQQTFFQLRQGQQQWIRESVGNFSDYLDEGYSVDEITVAIDAFRNSNFAAMFRAKQLRKNAEVTKINAMLAEKLEEHMPGAAAKGLSVQRKVPSDLLEGFADLPLAEQQQIADSGEISVDDVAYVIAESELSDDDIILLIDGLPDASATVGYEYLEEALSLLDFAAMAGRSKVFNRLLDAGLTPTHDAYLGSTMEWALSGLMNCCEKHEQRAEIINRLITLGARARFSEQSAESVMGHFPRRFYRFDEDEIENLRQQFNVNLLTIKPRQTLTTETHGRLYQGLVSERDAYLEEQLDIADVAETRSACQQTVEAIVQQWQPQSRYDVMEEVVARYGDSPSAIIADLADISPFAVDLYRQIHQNNTQRMKRTEVINEVIQPLVDGDIERVLTHLQQQSLTDAERWYLVGQIMLADVAYYQQLQQTDLLPQPLQHHQLKRFDMNLDTIKTLNDVGYDIAATDNRGKTLLYYAVNEKDLQLTTWLFDQGVPYKGDEQGADPMLLALRHAGSDYEFERINQMIDALMATNPEITRFHQSRMAVIKLRFPERYQQLIEQYPSLAISEQTPLPKVQ